MSSFYANQYYSGRTRVPTNEEVVAQVVDKVKETVSRIIAPASSGSAAEGHQGSADTLEVKRTAATSFAAFPSRTTSSAPLPAEPNTPALQPRPVTSSSPLIAPKQPNAPVPLPQVLALKEPTPQTPPVVEKTPPASTAPEASEAQTPEPLPAPTGTASTASVAPKPSWQARLANIGAWISNHRGKTALAIIGSIAGSAVFFGLMIAGAPVTLPILAGIGAASAVGAMPLLWAALQTAHRHRTAKAQI